jgi:hypothetical protein
MLKKQEQGIPMQGRGYWPLIAEEEIEFHLNDSHEPGFRIRWMFIQCCLQGCLKIRATRAAIMNSMAAAMWVKLKIISAAMGSEPPAGFLQP